MNIKLRLKNHLREVLKTKHSPHAIAMGFAIGTFIAILPTPGFSFIIGGFIILLYPRVSKYSLLVALFFWNPLVQLPIYALSYKIGHGIFGQEPIVMYSVPGFSNVVNVTRRFLVGNILLAFIFSSLSYWIVYIGSKIYRRIKTIKNDN